MKNKIQKITTKNRAEDRIPTQAKYCVLTSNLDHYYTTTKENAKVIKSACDEMDRIAMIYAIKANEL